LPRGHLAGTSEPWPHRRLPPPPPIPSSCDAWLIVFIARRVVSPSPRCVHTPREAREKTQVFEKFRIHDLPARRLRQLDHRGDRHKTFKCRTRLAKIHGTKKHTHTHTHTHTVCACESQTVLKNSVARR